MTWFDVEAQKVFGACGLAMRALFDGVMLCRVGYKSRYGLHWRGAGKSEQEALDAARSNRLPDDPSPSNQSWVPSSVTDPFAPYLAMETAHV